MTIFRSHRCPRVLLPRSRMLFAALCVMLGRPLPVSAQEDNPQRRWEHFYSQRAYPFAAIPPGALQAAREELEADWPNPFALFSVRAATSWRQVGPERIPIFMTSTGRTSSVAVHPTDPNTVYIGAAQGGVWKTVDGGSSWVPLTDTACSLAMGSIAIDPVDPNIVYAGTGEQHFSGDSYYGCGVLRSADGGATWSELGVSTLRNLRARIARVIIDPATAGSLSGTTLLVASDVGLFRSTNSGSTWTEVLAGTATDVVGDPSDPSVVYGAVWGSGVSKSSDGGATWAAINAGLPTTSIGRINVAISPSVPQTLLAAVQSTNGNGLAGIFKTTDGGTSWTQLTATNAGCGAQCWYDMAIAVHPTSDSIVYFGGISMFRSTDGGATFANVSGGIHVDQHGLAFDPQDPDVVYVGNDGGIYKSSDAGATWASLNTNLAITQFYGGVSLHPLDADVAMGGTQDNGTVTFTGTADWAQVLGGDGGFTAIDFDDPTTRYAETQWTTGAGISGPRRSDAGGFFGLKVNGINTGDRALFIPPLVMDPVNPQVLYFGTFRLYRTEDRADTWAAISPDLTTGGNLSAIAIAASDPTVIYVGSSSGDLSVTADGGGQWTAVNAGLPDRFITDIAIDETSPQIAFVTVSGFGSGHVFKTQDQGTTWQDVSASLPDVPVNAVLIEPGTPTNVYIGTDLGAFMTTDGGGNWTPFNDGLPLVAIFDLAIMPNTGVMMAATHGRGMFSRSVDIALAMTMRPTSRSDTLLEGSTTTVADSTRLQLNGVGSAGQTWTATHGAGAWLTLNTTSGMGAGYVRWIRDPSGLARGTYVDTITVVATGSVVAPVTFIDTLRIEQPLTLALGTTGRVDTLVSGSTLQSLDSVTLDLTGLGATTASWTATHGGGSWVTVATDSGMGSGQVRWSRSAGQLQPGLFVDTITVSTQGAVGSPLMVVDTLLVAAPIALQAAADRLFNGSGLSELQVAVLDALGNGDGVYNLGDVLAWIDVCRSGSPAACPASEPAAGFVTPLPARTVATDDTTAGVVRRPR